MLTSSTGSILNCLGCDNYTPSHHADRGVEACRGLGRTDPGQPVVDLSGQSNGQKKPTRSLPSALTVRPQGTHEGTNHFVGSSGENAFSSSFLWRTLPSHLFYAALG